MTGQYVYTSQYFGHVKRTYNNNTFSKLVRRGHVCTEYEDEEDL